MAEDSNQRPDQPPYDGTPLDPFLNDDLDVAALFGDESVEPLDDAEITLVREDLRDLEVFQKLLAPRGIRGIVIDCEGCGEVHYFAWEIMRANLHHMIEFGQSRVHEPPYQPQPDHFVSWEYARGYADARRADAL